MMLMSAVFWGREEARQIRCPECAEDRAEEVYNGEVQMG